VKRECACTGGRVYFGRDERYVWASCWRQEEKMNMGRVRIVRRDGGVNVRRGGREKEEEEANDEGKRRT